MPVSVNQPPLSLMEKEYIKLQVELAYVKVGRHLIDNCDEYFSTSSSVFDALLNNLRGVIDNFKKELGE
jgi:hypothetical protein